MKTFVSRKRFIVATAATTVLSMMVSLFPAAHAQAPNPAGANAEKHGVGVVDVSYIFKEHKRFRANMEAMKKEMEGIETDLKADREPNRSATSTTSARPSTRSSTRTWPARWPTSM